MKSQCVVALLAVCTLSVRCAFAFPSQAEIKTATEVVGDLVADDVRAANSNKLKHEDVADKTLSLVDQAETGAAKWVLFKHAFIQYAKAGQFEKAGEVLSDAIAMFPDVPPQMVIALIDKNCAKANAKNAPVLTKIRKLMCMRQKCSGIIANAKVSKQEKAEAYCLLGDWATGLKMLESLGGKTAEIAAAETNGKQPKHVIANYWWDYESALDTCDQFKAHAAEIYKAGLEDDSIAGLYKNVAEKRIAEMEAVPVVAVAPSATKAKGLIHRWSFNNDLKDSVGKSHGKYEGSITYKNNSVILPGGGKYAGAINLGSGLLPGDKEFTLELWAALNRISYFAPLVRLQYDGEKGGSHTYNNQFLLTWSYGYNLTQATIFAPYQAYKPKTCWALNEMYHFVIIGAKNDTGGMTVTYMWAKSSDPNFSTQVRHNGSAWTTDTNGLWLGRRLYTDNPNVDTDAAATYDEVRIWNRPLTQDELAKSHKAGPNKLF